ncbi:MAG: hypothetical protein NC923_02250 [Candidatus Omnitrophica bacterium]|nr:hypothetical protein [Candidatus Omnitrophota bacterium]
MEKYHELIAFFYSVLNKASREKFLLFKDFLKELEIDEDKIRRIRLKDEILLDILTDIYYSKKIKQSLKEFEPPGNVQEYINKVLHEVKEKAFDFFKRHQAKQDEFSIKEESQARLLITADRRFFPQDERILPKDKNVFNFELSCFYRKATKHLEISFSTRFDVKEKEISDMDSSNVTLFDEFIQAIGLSEFDKSVQFNAIYSDGQIIYDNNCEVYWTKKEKM